MRSQTLGLDLPTSTVGWVLTLLTVTLTVWTFIVVDRYSHSASDTLIGVFAGAWILVATLLWVASKSNQNQGGLSGLVLLGRTLLGPELRFKLLLEPHEVGGKRHAESQHFVQLLPDLQVEFVPILWLVLHLSEEKRNFGLQVLKCHGVLPPCRGGDRTTNGLERQVCSGLRARIAAGSFPLHS